MPHKKHTYEEKTLWKQAKQNGPVNKDGFITIAVTVISLLLLFWKR
jgi:hypothetical protein